jgi:hypothetical protein
MSCKEHIAGPFVPFRIDASMTQQPTLFSQGAPVSPQSPNLTPLPGGRKQTSRQVPLWLQYLELAVRVIVCIYVGLVLVVLPWTPYWSNNHLLLRFPHLAPLALNGTTRGIASGLGLLNIWIGMQDLWMAVLGAIHSRKRD